MADKVSDLVISFSDSLSDVILSRAERRDIKPQLDQINLSVQQKELLLFKVKELAINQLNGNGSEKVMEWFYEAVKLINRSENNESAESRVCFSPGTECREAINSQLRFATKRISICVFTISDDHITEEILFAHRRGVEVNIITDNDKAFDMGSDIERLEKAGIPMRKDRTRHHMHHKFALIDSDTVLTGSYNWTRSATDHNFENLLVVKDNLVFEDYEREFKKLWDMFE